MRDERAPVSRSRFEPDPLLWVCVETRISGAKSATREQGRGLRSRAQLNHQLTISAHPPRDLQPVMFRADRDLLVVTSEPSLFTPAAAFSEARIRFQEAGPQLREPADQTRHQRAP